MHCRHYPLVTWAALALAMAVGIFLAPHLQARQVLRPGDRSLDHTPGPRTAPNSGPESGPSFEQGPGADYLRPPRSCPTDLQRLVIQLLDALPSYANRVASRNLDLSRRPADPRSLVLVASRPDFTPIELPPTPGDPVSGGDSELQQVFFTTLERQYWQNRVVSLQHHHWLFLVQTPEGWRMALMYSSLGPHSAEGGPQGRPPTPPYESSDGTVGQAVRLWLRDCRAGAVFLAPAETVPLDVLPEVPSDVSPGDFPADIPESVPLEPDPRTRP